MLKNYFPEVICTIIEKKGLGPTFVIKDLNTAGHETMNTFGHRENPVRECEKGGAAKPSNKAEGIQRYAKKDNVIFWFRKNGLELVLQKRKL